MDMWPYESEGGPHFLDSSVLLAGMLQSEHGGNLHSEQERKVAPFTVSITFVITGERAKVAKCTAQNHKDKITVLE